MGKVESNKKQKKDALFNTAFELFTTKGTNKTTISDGRNYIYASGIVGRKSG